MVGAEPTGAPGARPSPRLRASPVTILLIAPLIPALGDGMSAAITVSILTVVVAAMSGAAHGRFGESRELVRVLSIAVGCVRAVIGTRLRGRLDALAQALDALPDAVTIQGQGDNVRYGNRAAAGLGAGRAALTRIAERMVLTDSDTGAALGPQRLPTRRLLGIPSCASSWGTSPWRRCSWSHS